ncbi:PA14 domain-containing protein, partial [uncultured Tenacibaculum sp.]|uniref:PA14 domain-containing protein n=1 Tax=uncultured Tenacibaculum sp. TaxID=174713 RepID=UPI002632E4D5
MRNFYTVKSLRINAFLLLILVLCFVNQVNSQLISATNSGSNCTNCAPVGWVDSGGTPDISNRTQAAAFGGSSGGGASWVLSPGSSTRLTLPLPPNNHLNWISLRDLGPSPSAIEERVSTTVNGLVSGQEYELIVYSLSAVTDRTGRGGLEYAGVYLDNFFIEIAGGVYSVSPPVNNWATERIRFIASSNNEGILIRPGNNSSATNGGTFSTDYPLLETVQLSITLNAINTVPVANNDVFFGAEGISTSFNVVSNDTDANDSVNTASVDLDPSTPGRQTTFISPEGSWSVDNSGNVTFTPNPSFTNGAVTISYTVDDNYTIDGNVVPATSNSAQITVNISPDADGDGYSNIVDLDSDNDGILDTVELASCGGISLEYYDGTPFGSSVDNIPTTGANITTIVDTFDIEDIFNNDLRTEVRESFGLRFKGFINITTAGTYTFYTTSDDGSKLFINGSEIVDNDGDHPAQIRSGNVFLAVGLHEIEVLFYENGGLESLEVQYELPGTISLQDVPFTNLYCNLDTDGDGILNHLDTDSDNDGCFDALEGGGAITTTQVNSSTGQINGGVNGNGVPNLITSGQSVGTSDDYNSRSSQCDDDNDGVPNVDDVCNGYDDNLDADMDGTPDRCDVDLDNDGILNSQEGLNCASTALSVGPGHTVSATQIDDMYSNNGVSVDLTTSISNATLRQLQVQNATTLRVQGDDADDGGADFVAYTFTFSEPVSNVEFRWSGIDQGDKVTITSTGPLGANNVFIGNLTNPVSTTPNDNYDGKNAGDPNVDGLLFSIDSNNSTSPTITSFVNGGNASRSYSQVVVSGVVTSFQVITRKARQDNNGINNGFLTFLFSEFTYCTHTDTDGDGQPDYLELDSDNDNCNDAVESGGIDANDDGILDGDGFNSNGQVTTSGAILGSSYNGATGNEYIATELTTLGSIANQSINAGTVLNVDAASVATNTTIFSSGTPNYGSGTNSSAQLLYEWQLDRGDGAGFVSVQASSSTSTYVKNPVLTSDAGTYRVIVTHSQNVCISSEINFTVRVDSATIVAENDDFTGSPVNGLTGGVAGNAITNNDTLNGVAVSASDVNITTTANTENITVDATG